jgi:hypothetical protein
MRDGTRRAASAHLASLRLNQGVPTTPSIPTFDRRSPLDSISRLRPRRGGTSTSQGHPRTIFRRALEHDNLVLAEVTAREIGRVTIAEALELTALVARKQPQRYGRVAARWLCLYLEEHEKGTLEDAELLVSKLRSLATPRDHASALAILRKA